MITLTMMLFASGCVSSAANDGALAAGLRAPMKAHALALSGDDMAAMRRTGLVVIEKFNAGVGL